MRVTLPDLLLRARNMVLGWSPMTVTVLWQSKIAKRTQILDLLIMSRDVPASEACGGKGKFLDNSSASYRHSFCLE